MHILLYLTLTDVKKILPVGASDVTNLVRLVECIWLLGCCNVRLSLTIWTMTNVAVSVQL